MRNTCEPRLDVGKRWSDVRHFVLSSSINFKHVLQKHFKPALTSFSHQLFAVSGYFNVWLRGDHAVTISWWALFFNTGLPYLRVYKPHFLTVYPPKLGCSLYTEYVLLTTEPAAPVFYVVKLPVETVYVWDLSCKQLHARMRQCITGVSVWRHRFPEVERQWHHWQIIVNAASDNWIAANTIANILLPHR
jgi:hypothetical protein